MKYTDQLLHEIATKGEALPNGGGQHKVADNLAKQGLIRLMPQWYKGWGQWYRATGECYIQGEGYIGNALCWWRNGGNGYTTDIREAEMFSTAVAARLTASDHRLTAHDCEYIEKCIAAQKLIIDSQYIYQ